jgi:hypothetical protein
MNVPSAASPPAASVPRELLSSNPAWELLPPQPNRIPLAGQAYLVTPLAARDGLVAILCESAVGASLPGRAQRRACRKGLDRLFPDHLTVFTDAAHSAYVWTWIARDVGSAGACIEHRIPGQEAELLRALRGFDIDPPRDGASWHSPDVPIVPVMQAVFGGALPPADPWEAVQSIEAIDDVTLLRRVWRSLTRVAIVDPDCGSAAWLLACAGLLEPLYLACLRSMRAFLAEPPGTRLPDFTELVELAEDGDRYGSPEAFARVEILQRNLIGIARTRTDASACAEQLAAELLDGIAGPMHPELDLNLAHGDPRRGFRSLAGVRHVLCSTQGDGLDLTEEIEVLTRATHHLRATRRERDFDSAEMAAAVAALRRRREDARRRLNSLVGTTPAGAPILHFVVDLPTSLGRRVVATRRETA